MTDLTKKFRKLEKELGDFLQTTIPNCTNDNEKNYKLMNDNIISLIKNVSTEQEKFFIYYTAIKTYILADYSPVVGNIRHAYLLQSLINSIYKENFHIEKIQLFRKFNDLPIIEGRFFIVSKDSNGKNTIFISRDAIEELVFNEESDLSLKYEYELLIITFFDLFYSYNHISYDESIFLLNHIWKSLSSKFKEKINKYHFNEDSIKPFMISDDLIILDKHFKRVRNRVNQITKEQVAITDANNLNTIEEDNNVDNKEIIEQQETQVMVDNDRGPYSSEGKINLEDITIENPEDESELPIFIKDSVDEEKPPEPLVDNNDDDQDLEDTDVEEELEKAPTISEDSLFGNRHLSWLAFNDRVLNQADDEDIPLFEQLGFIGITSNNLDEFFMVRIGSVLHRIRMESDEPDVSGLLPGQEYDAIISEVRAFYEKQNTIYSKILTDNQNIFKFKKYKELVSEEKKIVDNYFDDRIYEALTPHVIDEEKPFPMVSSKSLNIAVLLTDSRRTYNLLGIVKVPNHIPRLVPINELQKEYILIEDLILNNLDKIFINKKVKKKAVFRIVRNADISVEKIGNGYIVSKMKETLIQRELEETVRLEINKDAKKEMIRLLQSSFGISKKETYRIKTPIDLTFLMNLDWRDKKHSFRKFEPQISKYLAGERNMFDAIDEHDVILHHPYESFQPIIDFIEQAAHDPDVVAIKQTLYRVSANSPIINSLIEAAQQGKSVTVLFEVKARFNELSNIEWAEKLERVGGHVIYGTSGLKTHCKLLIVIKKNKKGNLRPYIHLGTGNYNEKTASVYTDFSFFTSNKKMCEEAVDIFNMLTGFSEPELKKLVCAPLDLRNFLTKMIQNEIDSIGKLESHVPRIIIKVNSLIDKGIIEKLYEASSKGVNIHLIVRGMCLINTSRPEATNIHVRSIIGRFLEHSRIYIFSNNGDEEVYLSSADIMERNLDRRFEIMFPIKEKKIKKDIASIIKLMVFDHNVKHYSLNGFSYIKSEGEDCQSILCNQYEKIGEELNVEKIFY